MCMREKKNKKKTRDYSNKMQAITVSYDAHVMFIKLNETFIREHCNYRYNLIVERNIMTLILLILPLLNAHSCAASKPRLKCNRSWEATRYSGNPLRINRAQNGTHVLSWILGITTLCVGAEKTWRYCSSTWQHCHSFRLLVFHWTWRYSRMIFNNVLKNVYDDT